MTTIITPCAFYKSITEGSTSVGETISRIPNRLAILAQSLAQKVLRQIFSEEFSLKIEQTSSSFYKESRRIVTEDLICAKNFVHDISKFVKSFDSFDTFLRFTHESVTFADLARYSDKVSRPILTYFGGLIGVINIGRFFSSINDLVSGKMYKEIVEKKYLDVAVTVSFFFARVSSTLTWLAQQNLLSTAVLTRPLQVLSQTRVIQVLAQNRAFQYAGPFFMRIPVISILYVTAFTALSIKSLNDINKAKAANKDISHLNWELKSNVAYVALCAIGLTAFGTPIVSAALAAIAAGCGMKACFVKIANDRKQAQAA